MAACTGADTDSGYILNEQEYFERQGVNVLVFSNLFTGRFNDEKTSGIELIHHGVRTAQGGAVRLSHTPEQWEHVPATTSRTVNKTDGSIEVSLRYEDYAPDSCSVIQITSKTTTTGRSYGGRTREQSEETPAI